MPKKKVYKVKTKKNTKTFKIKAKSKNACEYFFPLLVLTNLKLRQNSKLSSGCTFLIKGNLNLT